MAFKYIAYNETTPSCADATALEDRDLVFNVLPPEYPGQYTELAVAPLGYSFIKFKIGNSNTTTTTFTLTATGTSYGLSETYIYDEIYFSTNKINGLGLNASFADISDLDQTIDIILKPNEISKTIWAIFRCDSEFIGGDAEVKLKVEES